MGGQGQRQWGRPACAHRVTAVLLDHHTASKGLIVRFNAERSLFPVQDVSLHEDHVLYPCDLQGKGQRRRAGGEGVGVANSEG